MTNQILVANDEAGVSSQKTIVRGIDCRSREREPTPFSVIISKKRRLAVVTAHRPIAVSAYKTAITKVTANPNYCSRYRLLVDLRKVEFRPSASEVRDLASFLGQNRRSFKNQVAVVVSDIFSYGLARMASIYAGLIGFNLMVFDDAAETTTWITQN